MFSLKEFVKNGLIKAVGKMADYQVILNAAGWYDKGVLDDDDLVEIQAEIDKKNFAEENAEEIASEETETETVLE